MKVFQAVFFVLRTFWHAKRWVFVLFILVQTLIVSSIFLDTFTFKGIIDAATGERTIFGLSVVGFLLFRFSYQLIRSLLERLYDYLVSILDIAQLLYSTERFIRKLSTLDLPTYEDSTKHDLMWRSFNRINFQMRYYSNAIVSTIAQSVTLFISVVIFFMVSPFLALAIITSNIIPIIVRSSLGSANFNIWKADSETRRKFEYTTMLFSDRTSLPELKLFRSFEFLMQRLIGLFTIYTSKQLKHFKKTFFWVSIADLVPIVTIFVFLFVIAGQLSRGEITTGTFVFYFQNVLVFSTALYTINNWVSLIFSDSHFIHDMIDFYNLQSTVKFPEVSRVKKEEFRRRLDKPTIRLQHVSFKYPNAKDYVLRDITLTIPYGQNLALIGENGAGKTTLVKLLLRMYDPTEGDIFLNDVNIKDIPEDVLMQIYSTLFQQFGKFYLTIRENLQVAANRKLSDEEMVEALKLSNAWNYVKDFPKQLDQQLGPTYKDGVDLSGGQWQQLGIAKAMLKKTPILILDEPTSAIDAKAEMEIFDRINKETRQNTVIFISHRFSTIKDAERIIVLAKGKIVEDGTHTDLMKQHRQYARLYTIQAQRYVRDG